MDAFLSPAQEQSLPVRFLFLYPAMPLRRLGKGFTLDPGLNGPEMNADQETDTQQDHTAYTALHTAALLLPAFAVFLLSFRTAGNLFFLIHSAAACFLFVAEGSVAPCNRVRLYRLFPID